MTNSEVFFPIKVVTIKCETADKFYINPLCVLIACVYVLL